MVAETAVRLQEASKNYGEVRALDGMDFATRAGEIVAILGPNGAGKTTAISLMLGLRRPSSGGATGWRPPRGCARCFQRATRSS